MFKKVAWFGLLVVVVASLVLVGCSSGTTPATSNPAKTTAPHPIVTIDLRTTAFGTNSYIMGSRLEEASKSHPWLRITVAESPGAAWTCEYMSETPDAHKNTIGQWNAQTVCQYIKGQAAWEGKPHPEGADIVGLMCYSVMGNHFITLDPNIKTVKDLEGKQVGLGTKSQGGWAITPTEALKALGINAKLNYLSTSQLPGALLEGKVDAVISLSQGNRDGTFVGPSAVHREVDASQKPFYYVGYTEEDLKIAIAAIPCGPESYTPLKLPKGCLPKLDRDILAIGNAPGMGSHKDLPDDVAYEFVKLCLQDYPNWPALSAELKMADQNTMALARPVSYYHPAAVKAFKDWGIKY